MMSGEDAYVIVYDRRQTSEEGKKITIGGVFCYNEFIQKIKQDINLVEDDEFVVTTTNRNPVVDDDSYVKLIESGDTLYILESIDQPLLAPVSEKIEFQPHYDTLIKSGIYEYYASEGHVNPLPFAFAELIDNALAATVNNRGSRKIDLTLFDDSSSGQSTICVSDNGMGMSSRQLNNWAIYRLSKFNRKETKQRRNIFEDDVLSSGTSHSMEPKLKYMMDAPKSLNSDISWFGVGGKQAIFFIGSATRIISKPFNSCDVHEFTLSKDEFRRKEANRETIYSGYIRNRKAGDSSHITGNEEVTRQLIATETDEGRADTGFTSVIITGIDPKHITFMKQGFGVWTRQLSHIYHYYIHGPEGNTAMSRKRRNVGALDVNLNITMHERGKPSVTVDLRQINDDLESQYIRTACNSFEFKAKTDGGSGIVEGIIRYHPFMYDRETFPLDPNADDDFSDYEAPDEPPARGRRPIFECYWNGRLIPYTFVDDFDWCRAPRKRGNIPLECYSRVSGCLFTNDRFQVSTNKLTFIDLEAKLRDRSTVFTRMILGQEQRAHIQRQFNDWLRECHEKYDKQVKFLNFIESYPRTDIFGRKPITVYGAIEWDGKIFKEGQLVRTQRTTPVVLGRIKRFLLLGAHEGDVFAVGGEMEMVQEPESLYGEIRRFPLTKLDRVVSSSVVLDLIQEEEQKLPDKLVLSWPEGNEVKDGDSRQIGMTIGAMRIEIHNRRNESLQKLPSNAGGRKLLIEQRFTYTPSVRGSSPREIASHVTSHGRTWPYWFKKMDNIKSLGTYTIHLQTVLNESEASTYADGRTLPHMKISFTIREAPPSRFLVGILESPLRIGEPFDIPLELQDKYGHPTEAAVSDKPIIESEELDISFDSVECKGNTLVMKSVVAIGSVISQHGKSFTVTVIIPGLERESQTMKIRLLPGKPHSIKILSLTKNGDKQEVNKDDGEEDSDLEHSGYHFEIENLSNISLDVAVIDLARNVTLQSNLLVQAKFPPSCGVSPMKCDCSMSGQGVLSGRIAMKKLKKETKIIKTKIEILGCKNTESVLCSFAVQPSTKVSAIEIFYVDPNNEEEINLKSGSDIRWPAGDILTKLSFRLLDEVKREVTLNKNICSGLKVNWTNRVSIEQLCASELPNIRVPTNMTDVKFCQVVFAGQKNLEFSFSIRPIAGEPAALKCKIVGSRVTQIGVIRDSPVAVTILDCYGNKLPIKEGQFNSLRVTGEGLDETLVVKTIENNQFLLNNIQFNEGPLGSRELCVVYGNDDTIKEYVLLQLVAGTPAMIEVQGWTDIEKPLAILSGTRIPEPIKVQLKDGWGNPSPLLGVKVLLGKDSGLKLTPNPGVLSTDETGCATFGKFSVSGKRGEYNLSPRVVINRSTIEGIKLKLSVLPNTENPVSIKVKYDKDLNTVMAGSTWPDFTISVLSEEGTPVTSSVHICMAVWSGKPNKDKSVPTSAEFHRTDKPSLGTQCFQGITAATNAGDYCLCFCLCESKNSRNFTMISEIIKVKVYPGPPYKLYPDVDPGTPTVSNSKISRTIVRNLTLILKDCHGNRTGQDLDSNVVVTIETCDETLKSIEVPRFEGNSVRLRVPYINGSVRFQSLLLQEKSPGSDGGQYILHCEMESDQIDQKILPYRLKFLFYNDVEKQNRMSVLVKQRDILKNAIESYESLFNLHETLLTELQKTLKDAEEKKILILKELRKRDVELSPEITLKNIDKLIESFAMDREEIFNQPRRHCMLKEYPDQSPEILGKIGHLAVILDDDVGRVLSWHMMGDMDCLVTFTTKKAKDVHRTTGGTQQLLPLDSIYKKNLPDHTRPLPHLRAGVKHAVRNVTGNPVFARDMLYYPKDPDSCKIVFGMLLGETLIMDDLDSANAYRNQVVKYTYCPTILTRTGERIRSNGKFGGSQNRAPSFERLKGAVFGAKLPMFYDERKRQIDVLGNFKTSMLEYNSAVIELTNHETSLKTDEMLKKKLEHKEAVERLKEIELKIGLTKELSPRSYQRKTKASNVRYDSGASKRRRKYN